MKNYNTLVAEPKIEEITQQQKLLIEINQKPKDMNEKTLTIYPEEETNLLNARYFEFSDNTLCENSFERESISILDINQDKKDYIIIMSKQMDDSELINICEEVAHKSSLVIILKEQENIMKRFPSTPFLLVDSFKTAVQRSYNYVKNGQIIYFPKVDSNFDFFGYIETN